MKKVLTLFAIIVLCLSMTSCNQQAANANKEDFEKIKSELLLSLSTHENVEVNCDVTDDIINFTVSQHGVANTAIKAKDGDEDAIKKWEDNEMVYRNASDSLFDIALYNGLQTKNFRFSVLNDLNPSNALLMFQNGYEIYNYVKDINYMHKDETDESTADTNTETTESQNEDSDETNNENTEEESDETLTADNQSEEENKNE